MKTPLLALAAVAALFGAGCQTTNGSRDVVIKVTSATPVTFTGNIRTDGKVQPISGTTPAVFTVTGNRVDCQILQGPENGTLTVELHVGSQPDSIVLVSSSNGPGTEAKGVVSR